MRSRRWMKRSLEGIGLMLVLTVMAGAARGGSRPPANYCPPPKPTAVPEIDPGTVLSAMGLLGGGLFCLTDRRSK